jgi:serine/threonine-protein kinase RsbW
MESITKCRLWVIPARLESVNLACAEMKVWLEETIHPGQIFPLQMLAREALNNAVLHGCGEREEKPVRFQVTVTPLEVTLEVEDDGPGFDWRSVLGRKMVNGMEESGRGLYIYRMYADDIEFNQVGNQIRLIRRLPEKW